MMDAGRTPSQTVGPYLHIGLDWLAAGQVIGTRGDLLLTGTVYDGAGVPVDDALIETWQADAAGRYGGLLDDLPLGFGRTATDSAGRYRLRTDRPGAAPGDASHLHVLIFMRGLLKPLLTRIYWPGDPAIGSDPVLQRVPAARRASLLATAGDASQLHWDIHLQGPLETVFMEV
jgi:protocatechuate 3,4-dioxygenase alpha subunit